MIVENHEEKTEIKENSMNPSFDAQFSLPCTVDTPVVIFEVYDHDTASADDIIGRVEIPLSSKVDCVEGWFDLENPEDTESKKKWGRIHLVASLKLRDDIKLQRSPIYSLLLSRVRGALHKVYAVNNLFGLRLHDASNFVENVKKEFSGDYYKLCAPDVRGVLNVEVVSARGLPKVDT